MISIGYLEIIESRVLVFAEFIHDPAMSKRRVPNPFFLFASYPRYIVNTVAVFLDPDTS